MRKNKTGGGNQISDDWRRACPDYLEALFMRCLKTDRVPNSWSHAEVVAILKPSKLRHKVSLYRPSLLVAHAREVLCKVSSEMGGGSGRKSDWRMAGWIPCWMWAD